MNICHREHLSGVTHLAKTQHFTHTLFRKHNRAQYIRLHVCMHPNRFWKLQTEMCQNDKINNHINNKKGFHRGRKQQHLEYRQQCFLSRPKVSTDHSFQASFTGFSIHLFQLKNGNPVPCTAALSYF